MTTATARAHPRPLLEVTGLTVEYSRGRRRAPLRAVDDVSLSVAPCETVGLVGESGSGKSTLGRAVLGLAPVHGGQIEFDGRDITHASRAERQALSGQLRVIFQDPYSSLNPSRTVGQTLRETLRGRGVATTDIDLRLTHMLERVGLPADAASRFPSHFSGGQRQRIAIARALMTEPRLVICDEAVSALDLSVQAQILNLLNDLQRELGLSYLFISHDLTVVRHVSHRIVVLYRGRVMEEGPAADVYDHPTHPYTRALLAAAPVPDPARQRDRRRTRPTRNAAAAEIPVDDACPFASRCLHAVDRCRTVRPQREMTPDGRQVACHRWRELPRHVQPDAEREVSV